MTTIIFISAFSTNTKDSSLGGCFTISTRERNKCFNEYKRHNKRSARAGHCSIHGLSPRTMISFFIHNNTKINWLSVAGPWMADGRADGRRRQKPTGGANERVSLFITKNHWRRSLLISFSSFCLFVSCLMTPLAGPTEGWWESMKRRSRRCTRSSV